MKAVIVDSDWIRPIGSADSPAPCVKCLKPEGRWVVGKMPNAGIWCARCFLYETPWGQERARDIERLLVEVEREMGTAISRDGVVEREHADRILCAIVITSKLARSHKYGKDRRLL